MTTIANLASYAPWTKTSRLELRGIEALQAGLIAPKRLRSMSRRCNANIPGMTHWHRLWRRIFILPPCTHFRMATQSARLLLLIRKEVSKELFLSIAFKLFKRLRSRKKRVIVERQITILITLLANDDGLELNALFKRVKSYYGDLKSAWSGFARDLNGLLDLGALQFKEMGDDEFILSVDLDWPTTITETDFYKKVNALPKAKTHSFLK